MQGSARKDVLFGAARVYTVAVPVRKQKSWVRLPVNIVVCLVAIQFSPAAEPVSPLIRVADVIGGHVHPAIGVTGSGDLLAVYNKSGGGGKELLLCRSRDGGRTWSSPAAVPVIKDCSIYPGSLTTLRDGRVVLHWSCYRHEGVGNESDDPKYRRPPGGKATVAAYRRWRVPQFCISADEGKTWSQSRDLPIDNYTNHSCLRHPILELNDGQWVCPLYDRTIRYNPRTDTITKFGDGRNHGMVPIVRTSKGTIISGAPQADAPAGLVGPPGKTVRGLRSTDGGKTWQALHALPYFGVAGYDLTVLENGWIVLTSIVYGVGRDGEWSYELIVSRDDGLTWDHRNAVEIYNPARRIKGRGWPRTVQIDNRTLGTLFYDLDANQAGGPGLFFVRTPVTVLEQDEN